MEADIVEPCNEGLVGRVSSFFSNESSLSTVPSDFETRAACDRIASYHPRDSNDNTQKVLSSFIQYLPVEGRCLLSQFIVETSDDGTLFDLYNHLLTTILVPMKARGPTPGITPSPFSNNEAIKQEIAALITESPSRIEQRKLKAMCLERDNFQCMLTGFSDALADDDKKREGMTGDLELAHILPFSISQWKNTKEHHEIAQIWTTLKRCFPQISLGPSDINRPINAMTLFESVHSAFGRCAIALEPTEVDNEYQILILGKTFPTFLNYFLPKPNDHGHRLIKFTQHSDVELPSRSLLLMHASLAKILHASGMSERIDKVLQDREDIGCLATDGSTRVDELLFAF
ncbi:hypothetical protein L228DRAFT_247558 [Xylona heveae TC161]|uniref:HNH nuclease domain-containing protein n=1 Tax=Xylona heveae (strain CBS 132557 / TC161) TaxID=1328760 RepID=A0A165GAB8_XYLHT|nr:hypothetical protein L228DRAFT_247558 [Xylona heveae TC161]KZF21946.1 hypothetical protein L228DRAFT_247558 [Xylona heveae TC161]